MYQNDLRALQLKMLDIVQAIEVVCNQHHIDYAIYAGSLLGSVRHKGFIPWDDDMDIMMPRPHYDRFVRHAGEWLPEGLEMVCSENDPTFSMTFGKVQDTRTTLIEKNYNLRLGGVYVDVFPIDGMPDGSWARRWHLLRYRILFKSLYFISRNPYKHGHGPSSWLPLLVRRLTTVQQLQQGINRLAHAVDYDTANFTAEPTEGLRGVLPCEVHNAFTICRFEGVTLHGLKHSERYLQQIYGNYLQIPDVGHRHRHLFFYMDLNTPFRENKPAQQMVQSTMSENLQLKRQLIAAQLQDRVSTLLDNLDDEQRFGYTVTAETKRLWLCQLDMLRHLLEVCNRHHLRIWVDSGTMLGAIRHKGYIPWDDDIDVAMPRADYDKLMQLDYEFGDPYFLQNPFTDKYYFRGHAQLRYDGTCAIRPSECYRKFHQGIFIDIFPLDAVPDNPKEAHRLDKKQRHIQKLMKAAQLNLVYSGRIGQVFRKIRAKVLFRTVGREWLIKRMDDALRSVPEQEVAHWATITLDGLKYLYDRHIFDRTVYVDFEKLKVPVPAGWDKYLRTQYGDTYMTPLQVATGHGELVISTDRDWTDVAPEVTHEWKRKAISRLFDKLNGKKKKS